MTEQQAAAAGLRQWARGCEAEEAAVELLIRSFGGRFAHPHRPWVRPCERQGWFWVDAEALADCTPTLSGAEHRLLAVVEALVSAGPLWDVAGLLGGLDRHHLGLVLAAMGHAAGANYGREPLVPWPEPTGLAA